jgi:HEAT repeat protein
MAAALFAVMAAAILPGPLSAQEPAATRPMLTVADQALLLRSGNATQAERDEAARRLVADRSPAARQAIRNALVDLGSRRGQLAVARALATSADGDGQYSTELFALASGEPPTNEAAIAALANDRAVEVRTRLREMARDPERQQRESTRLAAIGAIGNYSDKASAAALIEIAANESEGESFRRAAADALAAMTGIRGNGRDVPKWQQWWAANQQKDDAAFESEILQTRAARFVRWQRRYDRLVEESRSILAEAYQTATDKGKEQLLVRYLKAESPETRGAGVQIVHDEFTQNRPIPATVRAQLRSMVGDSSTMVRIQVVLSLQELNDASALPSLLNQLKQEPDAEVRSAIVEALVLIQDLSVVPQLLESLNDPSLMVAESAAKGLARLGPMIRDKNAALAQQTAGAVQDVMKARTGPPGTAALRAALVDALAPMRNANLRMLFAELLQPTEPVPVRRSAVHALGEFQQTWAADILVNSLSDPQESVRVATLEALNLCATFEHAERIYELLRSDREPEAVKQKAWDTLCALFPKAEPQQLARWADRFKQEPPRRFIIFKQLADRLQRTGGLDLALVQQDIGDVLMKMNDPEQAAVYYDAALQFHRNRPGAEIGGLLEQEVEALLASAQYDKAADFAAKQIAANQQNQLPMGAKLRNRVDTLRKKGDIDGALKLIDCIKKMKPQLAEMFMTVIQEFEDSIRKEHPERNRSSASEGTRSAVGTVPAGQQ